MEITQHQLFGLARLRLKLDLGLDPLTGSAIVRVEVLDGETGALVALRQADFVGWLTPSRWASELTELVTKTVEDLTGPFPD